MKKTLKSVLFLLVLAGLTVGLAFIVVKNMDKSGETGKPITMPVPKTTSVTQPVPIKKINMNKIPQPNTPSQTAENKPPLETPPPSGSEMPTTSPAVADIAPSADTSMKEIAQSSPAPETKPVGTIGSPVNESSKKISPEDSSKAPEDLPETDLTETVSSDETTPEDEITPKKETVYDTGDDTVYSLNDISFKDNRGKLEMKLIANRPLNKYKFFVLSKPSRIVIDLFGQWNKPPFWEKNVATSRIVKLRIWRYKDKLRIVGDLKNDKTVNADFTPVSDGVIMTIK